MSEVEEYDLHWLVEMEDSSFGAFKTIREVVGRRRKTMGAGRIRGWS